MSKIFIIKYRREKPYRAAGEMQVAADSEYEALNQFAGEREGCVVENISESETKL